MSSWKIDREELVDVALSALLALPFYPLIPRFWPEQPPETLGYYLRDWAFFVPMILCLGLVRAVRLWRDPHAQRATAFRKGAIELLLGALYFVVIVAGAALLWSIDNWILQAWPFWARFAVAVPLGFPALFCFMMLGMWSGSVIRGRIAPADNPQIVTRQIAVPDATLRAQLPPILVLRRAENWMGWLCLPCLALSVGAWTGYHSALSEGKLDSALLIASFALWIGLGGVFSLTQSGKLGRISATELKPRFRRAFNWQEVASIEESLARNLLGIGEIRVLQFQNARGQSLWNLGLSEINADDLKVLKLLLPDV